ncbi:MAG: GNAT family acetyltransferase [Thermoplasmata archaeon]|nr:GNAT family acetyltransferase [Thermoplasmata archaeon]
MPARLVTLSTDFGPIYAAQVKGILAHFLPADRIVELSEDLPIHQVRESAFLVRQMARTFPAGTVHLVVVDPGVGGGRAALAVRCRDGSVLVGPDNGVLSPLATELGVAECVRLDPNQVGRTRFVSATFEGRDLFAPAAGRIARGTALRRLGRPTNMLRLRLPLAHHRRGGAEGEVFHTDRFGNAVTNIPSEHGPPLGAIVRVGWPPARTVRARSVRTYSELALGELGVLPSSFGLLELSQRESRASDRWNLRTGDPVRLVWAARGAPPSRPAPIVRTQRAGQGSQPRDPVRVRRFESTDFGEVVRIWKAAGLELGPSDTLPEIARALRRDPDLFLVAERRGRLVGAVLGRFDGRRGWVNHLAVRPDEQTLGTGSRLVRRLESALRSRGCRKVNLHVLPANLAALAFYQHLGYRRRDLVMMERWLPRSPPPRAPNRSTRSRRTSARTRRR